MAGNGVVMATLLLVRLYHGHEVSRTEVDAARLEVQAIFRAAGMEVEAMLCGVDLAPGSPCLRPIAPTELLVRLRPSGSAPQAGPTSMGFANVNDGSTGAPVLATVFVDRVSAVARTSEASRPQLLGRAVAHEIGHLLLNSPHHARRGLMRAHWSRAEIRRNEAADWHILEDDARLMQAAVAERVGGATGASNVRSHEHAGLADGRTASRPPNGRG